MTTSTQSSTIYPPDDLPIIVQDRRRQNFFMIDNVLISRYGKQLKSTGIAVYNVLAMFTNRDGKCFPSQSTIAKLIGMSRMQVNREIAKLQRLQLISVEPQYSTQGQQRANLYTLLDLAESEVPVTHRYTPGNSELHPPVTDSYTPCNRQLHEQDLHNKTQFKQNLEEQQHVPKPQENIASGNAPTDVVVALALSPPALPEEKTSKENTNKRLNHPASIPLQETGKTNHAQTEHNEKSLSAVQQTSADALIARGLAEKVALRLALHYSPERIAQKLDYLAFVQEERPEQVANPCGWLRKAIEDDYAPPDGYTPLEEVVEMDVVEQFEEEPEQALETHEQPEPAAQLTSIQAIFGTTEYEMNLWQQMLAEFKWMLPASTFERCFADTQLLSLQNGEALIGLPSKHGCDWLANRFGQKIVHALATKLGGQSYTVKFIDLSLVSTPPLVP